MKQDGFALALVLGVLAVAMLVGASLASSAADAERVARAERDRLLAFNMAEAALHEAEVVLDLGAPDPAQLSARDWRAADLLHGDGIALPDAAAGQSGMGPMPAQPPRYLLERLALAPPGSDAGTPPPPVYRITAIGFGPRADTYAVVQSVYRPVETP